MPQLAIGMELVAHIYSPVRTKNLLKELFDFC